MDPEKIMVGISNELNSTLITMSKCKTPEERLLHSETVKNLCESPGVFLHLMVDIGLQDDDIPF